MKLIHCKIRVCPECPFYDDKRYRCRKSDKAIEGFNPPDWCVLEECDE